MTTQLKDFVEDGVCTQLGGEVFFADEAGDSTIRQARPICVTCPVVQQCFDWAMAQGVDLAGTWAGTTQRERQRAHLKRNQRAAA